MVCYYENSFEAFERVEYLISEVNLGWLVRVIHINGSSLIFGVLYLHIFKNLWLKSIVFVKP